MGLNGAVNVFCAMNCHGDKEIWGLWTLIALQHCSVNSSIILINKIK